RVRARQPRTLVASSSGGFTMFRFRVGLVLVLVPALAVVLAGCGGDKDNAPKSTGAAKSGGGGGGGGGKFASSSGGAKAPLEATGVCTLKGKVTYDGDPPKRADLKPAIEMQQDKNHCLQGETLDPTWIVDENKGVANVVVWLRPPDGKFFVIPPDQQ